MLVDPSVIDQINSKIRRRVLELPVKQGSRFGELKKCPMREGGVYKLQAAIPYGKHRAIAEAQPTVARSVLLLIERCMTPAKTVMITVTEPVVRNGDRWVVRFEKGDWSDQGDEDVYLCRDNDFTTIASRQTVKGDPPLMTPFAKDLEHARKKAREKREQPYRSDMALLRAAQRRMAVRKHDMQITARKRLALIERETEKLASELSVESDAILPVSDRVQSQSPDEANVERRPTDIESLVSLEPAA
jgi:hypothetical protein